MHTDILVLFKSLVPAHTRRLKTGKVVRVRQYRNKVNKRPDEDDRTRDMFADDTVAEPRQDLIDEHKRLVDVLESPSHKDDKVEAKKQAEELREYEGKGDSGQYLDHVNYLTGHAEKDNLLDYARYIEQFGNELQGTVPDDVRRAVNLTAQAIHYMASTGRMPANLGLAAKKLTGNAARKVMAEVAKRAGQGSVQTHIDAVTDGLLRAPAKPKVVSVKAR